MRTASMYLLTPCGNWPCRARSLIHNPGNLTGQTKTRSVPKALVLKPAVY